MLDDKQVMEGFDLTTINVDELEFDIREYGMYETTNFKTGDEVQIPNVYAYVIECQIPEIKIYDCGHWRSDHDNGVGHCYEVQVGSSSIVFESDGTRGQKYPELQEINIIKIGSGLNRYLFKAGYLKSYQNVKRFDNRDQQDFTIAVFNKAMEVANVKNKIVEWEGDEILKEELRKIGKSVVSYDESLKKSIKTGVLINE